MRYLVKGRVKAGRERELVAAVRSGSLGTGSVAYGEYVRNMKNARLREKEACWVEVCYCPTPLEEEKPYWHEYFDVLEIKDAHSRSECRDLTGKEPWACSNCDCTERLEERMKTWGPSFLAELSNDTQASRPPSARGAVPDTGC